MDSYSSNFKYELDPLPKVAVQHVLHTYPFFKIEISVFSIK
jgi:hypothetical protein